MGSGGISSSNNKSESSGWSQSISEYFSNAFSQNTSASQQTSQSGTRASELSNEQLGILQERRDMANNFFFPELQNAIKENTAGTKQFDAAMAQQAGAINTQYNAAQKATEQSLSQMGLKGSSTGVEAALTAANNRARSSALAQAYYNQLAQAQTNKQNLLNTMGAMMPQTTNSAEYYQSSQSQGTSTAQGTSESHSEGTSSSKSKNESSGKGGGWGVNASLFG